MHERGASAVKQVTKDCRRGQTFSAAPPCRETSPPVEAPETPLTTAPLLARTPLSSLSFPTKKHSKSI